MYSIHFQLIKKKKKIINSERAFSLLQYHIWVCALLRVCVKCRAQISLLVIFCIIVYVPNKKSS